MLNISALRSFVRALFVSHSKTEILYIDFLLLIDTFEHQIYNFTLHNHHFLFILTVWTPKFPYKP